MSYKRQTAGQTYGNASGQYNAYRSNSCNRLRDGVFPLKSCSARRISTAVIPKMAGRDDEFMQSGVEIIGGDESVPTLRRSALRHRC